MATMMTATLAAPFLAGTSANARTPMVSCEKIMKEQAIRKRFDAISNAKAKTSEFGELFKSAQFNCMCGDGALARSQFRQAEAILEDRAAEDLVTKVEKRRLNLTRAYFSAHTEEFCSLDQAGSE